MCARYAIHASRPMENKEREETRLWPLFLCGDAAEKSTSDEVEESRAMDALMESFAPRSDGSRGLAMTGARKARGTGQRIGQNSGTGGRERGESVPPGCEFAR